MGFMDIVQSFSIPLTGAAGVAAGIIGTRSQRRLTEKQTTIQQEGVSAASQSAVAAQLQSVTAAIRSWEEQAERWRGEWKFADERNKELTLRVDQAGKDIDALRTQMAEQKQTHDALLAGKDAEIATLTAKVETLERKLADLERTANVKTTTTITTEPAAVVVTA